MTDTTPQDRRDHQAGIVTRGARHVSSLTALAATRDSARTTLIAAQATKAAADAAVVAAQAAYDAAANAWSAETPLGG